MPVQKFRSFEDAKEALWGRIGDPEHLKRVAWLWAFSQRLRPARPRPGLRRYRSSQEAQEDAG
jgi:hypothetical protein